MIIITLLTAILLSGLAGYFSIIGLAATFPGAFWAVVYLGGSLEVAKLVTVSWLYRNWSTAPNALRIAFGTSTAILMLITSMGIFGFLSKSHIDSTADFGNNAVELKNTEAQEKMVKERLEYLLARAKDPATASNRLDKQIQETQKLLKDIVTQKLPLLKAQNKLTVDVGPIKYVAALVYGEQDGGVEKAVRLVIMIIMLVFDPLAVLLLIAANISLKERNENRVHPPRNKEDNSTVQVQKENIATIPENMVESKKLKPKYDYRDEFSFKERE